MIKANKVTILSIIVTIIVLSLSLWVLYSYYNFYQRYKIDTKNISVDSYIDKAGLSDVKSKLESRK